MLTIQNFVFNPLQENTLVVFDETKQAVIIDPGCYERAEKKELDDFISDHQLTVTLLLNTHCHFDHVLGNDHVKEKYKVPLLVHAREQVVLEAVKSYVSNYGFAAYHETVADRLIEEGDTVDFGVTSFRVLFLPGHSPGHVAFYHPGQKVVISGDVLFNGSVGRTDLPGGDFDTLINSIQQKLFVLPDDVVVYPGHGPVTTLGKEKVSNPFCALSLHR